MKSPIIPMADRVVLVREKPQDKTANGLYLPDTAKEKPTTAKVIAIGSSVKDVVVSDQVVYKEYSTTELKIDNVEYLILKEEDILAKLA